MDCKSRLNTLSDSSVTMLTHNYDAVVLKKHNNDFFQNGVEEKKADGIINHHFQFLIRRLCLRCFLKTDSSR